MTTIPHESRTHEGTLRVLVENGMWEALAIAVMWLAVLFAAIYGPDFVSTSAGGDSTTIPSAVPIALFAFLATWVVAKHGLRRQGR